LNKKQEKHKEYWPKINLFKL